MSKLSRTDREFLHHLKFREAGNSGRPCWMYWMPGDRWQLVVWTMMGTWERSPFVKRWSTIDRLMEEGLLASGGLGSPPAPFHREHGSVIALTEDGRAALGDKS